MEEKKQRKEEEEKKEEKKEERERMKGSDAEKLSLHHSDIRSADKGFSFNLTNVSSSPLPQQAVLKVVQAFLVPTSSLDQLLPSI